MTAPRRTLTHSPLAARTGLLHAVPSWSPAPLSNETSARSGPGACLWDPRATAIPLAGEATRLTQGSKRVLPMSMRKTYPAEPGRCWSNESCFTPRIAASTSLSRSTSPRIPAAASLKRKASASRTIAYPSVDGSTGAS
jgi:hypothetical protein